VTKEQKDNNNNLEKTAGMRNLHQIPEGDALKISLYKLFKQNTCNESETKS
jgi:acyl-CoA-binding protein